MYTSRERAEWDVESNVRSLMCFSSFFKVAGACAGLAHHGLETQPYRVKRGPGTRHTYCLHNGKQKTPSNAVGLLINYITKFKTCAHSS
jgi:hypothetical protein